MLTVAWEGVGEGGRREEEKRWKKGRFYARDLFRERAVGQLASWISRQAHCLPSLPVLGRGFLPLGRPSKKKVACSSCRHKESQCLLLQRSADVDGPQVLKTGYHQPSESEQRDAGFAINSVTQFLALNPRCLADFDS